MEAQTAAQRLARWVNALRYEDLPLEVVYHAKRCMLDTLGVQLRGATLPWVQPVYQYARTVGGGSGAATISYHGDRVAPPYAAYANSAFSYSCELQHHGSPESGHTGVIVIPAVQALGEQLGASGRDIITAMVAGYEVQGRLGAALYQPAFKRNFVPRERHFHIVGLQGPFGAAAAAGKMLGLDETQQAHAFAIAGSHASTIKEYDQSGGEVKRIHGAIAARGGMQSALLAKAGLTGPLTVFEGRHGVFAAFGGAQPDPAQLFNELGDPYCITRCRYRIYPTIGTCHNALDIVNDLMRANPFDHRDVESIRVGMEERGIAHVTSITRPHDVISAQASLGYSLGVRLVKGSNSLEMYINPELWRDPAVLAVVDKLQPYVVVNESQPRYTKVEIKLKNGKVLEGELGHTRGSEKLPFSDEVIENKFRQLAEVVLPKDRVEQIIQTVAQLEQVSSASQLVAMLQKP